MNQTFIERLYEKIHPLYKRMANHGVPEYWLAGLIMVEDPQLNPRAFRFEEHVYQAVLQAYRGRQNPSLPGFISNPRLRMYIQSTKDTDRLRSLATSYGLGQIMGYHYLDKFNLKPEEFTNLTMYDSLRYTLEFMALGMKWLAPGTRFQGVRIDDYEQLLRWWNTGSTSGTTYNGNYVKTAKAYAAAYKALLLSRRETLDGVHPADVKSA